MALFESENGETLLDPSKQQVFDELKKLDGVRRSYAYFTDDRDCYIQVGGGPVEFTVEIRHIKLDGTFRHWKASLQTLKNDENKNIIISGTVVHLKSSQLLDKKKVKELFGAFVDGDKLPKKVEWNDITKMFVKETKEK